MNKKKVIDMSKVFSLNGIKGKVIVAALFN